LVKRLIALVFNSDRKGMPDAAVIVRVRGASGKRIPAAVVEPR